MAETLLSIQNLECSYGHIKALAGVDLEVNSGEIVTLIGNNGAGKSTTLNAVCGTLPLNATFSGTILFQGKRIDGLPSDRIVGNGVCQVPEGRRIFSELTVEENLLMGALLRKKRDRVDEELKMVYDIFPILSERRKQLGGQLSGGQQQMLAIGRGLMSSPTLLLLDEPSLGLAPLLVLEILRVIREINARGTTVLLVEQNAKLGLETAHKGYVIEKGKIVLHGTSERLLSDEEVRKIYLGEN
jgi:branched-chain amino acid transport system ATP-binding protein